MNGTALHVAIRGPDRAPTLLLLHYFASAGRAWDAVAGLLAARARCVMPDLRGHGASAWSAGGYAVANAADDVAALVRALALDVDEAGYTLLGHSMGGKIALAFAARRPPGLQSLVLLAPSPATPEPMDEAGRQRQLAAHGDRAAAQATARHITRRALPAAMRDRVVADNLRTASGAWRAWLSSGSREDISALMPDIQVPVLAVAGNADPVIPADLVRREIGGRIVGTRLTVVPECGHLLPLEAPRAVATLLAAWVDRPCAWPERARR